MRDTTFNIDFFQHLVTPIVGLVSKITSPKGIRYPVGDDYRYNLHHELVDVYSGEGVPVTEGLYWVFDIYKSDMGIVRNSYIFVVSKKGDVTPVAEYLDYPELSWVPEALPILKAYFGGKKLPCVELTKIKLPEKVKKEDKRFKTKT